ncbi:MAG: ATP-binding cassette domain-containing protein [Bifidobacteriaceae bacterium]|jgi:ABC-2 type transport system ATP-binding protein|nr:ATP-binding cassette domain-containing protein [Bifidobacteriaceae bacterium]
MKLEVKNLEKTFKVKSKNPAGIITKLALNDVSFDVPEGEVFGFIGANGAGKSTTMRIVMGVMPETSGEVYLGNECVVGKNKVNQERALELRRSVGYMPAERGLYGKMKVEEQLIWFSMLKGLTKNDAQKEVKFWLEFLQVDEFAEYRLEKLSTGNAQRVQLAAALSTKPELLILDEPFSGLDPIAVKVMADAFRESVKSGLSILFSSHQLELIGELCDVVGIIQSGKMVQLGTPDELRQRAGAPLMTEVPTPLADIFGDLVLEEKIEVSA